MRSTIVLAALLLAGCASDGTLTSQGKTAVTVLCQADAVAQPLAKTGAIIAATVDPTIAPEVALANAADQLAHPAVQAACAGLGSPVAVTVMQAP